MSVINFEDGQCRRVRSYLDSYLNDELMVETNHEVLTHLQTCESCSRTLEDRARVKTQLKHAVNQENASAALRARIADDLGRSRGFRFNRFSYALTAAAAALVIAAGTFFLSSGPSSPSGPSPKGLSLQASVAPDDANGQILKIGFDDHVFCAIDHHVANRQFTNEQMTERLGPEYAGLVDLVKQRMPANYTVTVGHRCHYQGREFVHLIMRSGNDMVSLVITRKNGEAFRARDAATIANAATEGTAAGSTIYQAGWANQQVAGMETRDHLVFVISNETRETNFQIASSLAPSVRDLLVRLES